MLASSRHTSYRHAQTQLSLPLRPRPFVPRKTAVGRRPMAPAPVRAVSENVIMIDLIIGLIAAGVLADVMETLRRRKK